MNSTRTTRALFLMAAIYDGALGLAFLFVPSLVFERFDVMPPNHLGYVHFPAALLLVFAWMFLDIARNPFAHVSLIRYGILMKASYSGVVLYHWFRSGVPPMWKPFAIMDLIFIVMFVWAFRVLSDTKKN